MPDVVAMRHALAEYVRGGEGRRIVGAIAATHGIPGGRPWAAFRDSEVTALYALSPLGKDDPDARRAARRDAASAAVLDALIPF